MEPQNLQPQNIPPQPPSYPTQPVPPAQMFQPGSPAPVPSKKKWPMFAIIIVLLLLASFGAWYFVNGKKDDKESPTQSQPSTAKTDKEGIQDSVDKYCQSLAKAYGFTGMDSGYIISDRFTEAELSDSPGLLRFNQVDDAASATVDCEDSQGPTGIGNDLLFVKENGSWDYKDEVQNGTGSFLCTILDKYNVSKKLAPTCSPDPGSKAQAR